MADHAMLNRSRSFLLSQANDAASSSGQWETASQVTVVPPEIRSVSPTPAMPFPLPPPPSANATVHTAPGYAESGPQQRSSDATGPSATRIAPISRPDFELNDGVLKIMKSLYGVRDLLSFFSAGCGLHTLVVRPGLSSFPIISQINQFSHLSVIRTLKLDGETYRSYRSSQGQALMVPDMMDDAEADLVNSLAKNTTLAKLDLSDLCFDERLLFRIASALAENTTLRVLDLTGDETVYRCRGPSLIPRRMQNIGDGIAAIISNSHNLESLTASQQCIDEQDAMVIAAALKGNTSLTELVLADNMISAKGSGAIFDAVRKNRKPRLENLDLSGCQIDAAAARSLANLLKEDDHLIQVSIGMVPDADCLNIIYEGLSKNRTLEELRFTSKPDAGREFRKITLKMMLHFYERETAAPNSAPHIAYRLNSANISFDGRSNSPKKSS